MHQLLIHQQVAVAMHDVYTSTLITDIADGGNNFLMERGVTVIIPCPVFKQVAKNVECLGVRSCVMGKVKE